MRSSERALVDALQSWPGVRLAVLFGSAARGSAAPGSDIDVGVLFEPGQEDATALEVALARATGRRVDLVRLDVAPPLLRFEIACDGRLLLERTPYAWVDFRARAMTDWWDWAPTARFLHAAAVARLRAAVADGSP
jgi:predicted nucleotidyltransferase